MYTVSAFVCTDAQKVSLNPWFVPEDLQGLDKTAMWRKEALRKNFHDPEQELDFHKHHHKLGGCLGFIIARAKKIKLLYRWKTFRYVLKRNIFMVHLTHHKYQLSHVGPGEVVQELPHRPDIL